MSDPSAQRAPSAAVLAFTACVGALLAAFLIYPLLYVLRQAFWVNGHFSLAYFRILFVDNIVMRDSILNSLVLAFMTTVVTTLLALPLALISVRYRFRGKGLLFGMLLVPLIMPPFVGAVGIKQLLSGGGTINLLLTRHLGLLEESVDFTGRGGFVAIVVMQVLHLYPIMYLNVTAALANVDPSLEEAARNMGDSGFRLFRKIHFPLMLPGYFAGAVLVFIWAFTDLGTPLIFGFRRVVGVQIYDSLQAAEVNRIGYALVVVVAVVSSAVFLLGRLYVGRRGYEMLSKGTTGGDERPVSARVTALLWAAVGAVVFVAVLPHLSVFMTSIAEHWSDTVLPSAYTTQNYADALTDGDAARSIRNSLMLSTGSMAIDVFLGVSIAYILMRKRFAGVGLLDALAMLPLALPGIVIAFGYATCFTGTPLDARANPFPLLMIAYAVRRLPFMVRASCAGFQQTSVVLEEAAQNVGASPLRTLFKVTLPLIMANIIAGAVLCFSFAMLEVSDSMVLAFKPEHYPITKAIYTLLPRGPYVPCAMGMLAMVLLVATLMTANQLLGKRLGQLFRVS